MNKEFRVELGRGYYILADTQQYILAKKNNKYNPNDKKSSEFIHVGYFSKLGTLLRRYVEEHVKSSDVKTLSELRETIKVVCRSLSEVSMFMDIELRVIDFDKRVRK